MSLSSREPKPQCARTAAKIASPTPGAVSSAPFGYDPYSTSRSTRSGNAAAKAMAVQLPDEPPIIDKRAQRRDLLVEVQFRFLHSAIRHTYAEPVVADQCVAICDRVPEPPKVRALPVE